MAQDTLRAARNLMRRRKFSAAIKTLESRDDVYRDNFDWYLLLGLAYLYAGDTGTAAARFNRARGIKQTNTTLLLSQAVIFLRRGDTKQALRYYLLVQDNDPQNKTAKAALEFIRTCDYGDICRMVDSGEIEKFYPPLGANPRKILGAAIPLMALALGALAALEIPKALAPNFRGARADLSEFALSKGDFSAGGEGGAYSLTPEEIESSYNKMVSAFQGERDNAARIEANRLLNSNAPPKVKGKVKKLEEYFFPVEPSFDAIKSGPSYGDVKNDLPLYLGAWVKWSGRVVNVEKADGLCKGDFLVGSDATVEGIVPIVFDGAQNFVEGRNVAALGKISLDDDGRLFMRAGGFFQSVDEKLETP